MVWGWTCTSRGRCWHTSYLSFFLHICNFWFNFSPHKSAWIMTKHICDKQHKLQQNRFTTKQHRFYILSSSYICHRRRNLRFLHLCHVNKFEIAPLVVKLQISPHLLHLEIWNFFSWQISSPQIYCWYWWQIWGMGVELRVATIYPTIAMGLHFLVAIFKKQILQSCNLDIILMGLQLKQTDTP